MLVQNTRWKVAPGYEAQVHAGDLTSAVAAYQSAIESLGRVKPLTFLERRREAKPGENVLVCVLKEGEVVIPMASMVDVSPEQARLTKEIDENEVEANRLEIRLEDAPFLDAGTCCRGRERA